MWLRVLILLFVGVAFGAGGYKPDVKVAKAYEAAVLAGQGDIHNPRAGDPAAVARGRDLYTSRCAVCHGLSGKGDGPAAVSLNPRPADFTDPSRWAFTSEGTKRAIMKTGVTGTGMAPLGLTDDEAWDVLAYIKATFQPAAP